MGTSDEQIDDLIDILLVEPNPGDSRLFTENFSDAKLLNTIYTVSDAESALDFLHQRNRHSDKPRPDIVLLEPQLPRQNGMDVLSELKNEPALDDIPVIVLTSSEAGEDIMQSYGIDADSYIRKPVEPDEFVEFVQSIEDFWFAIVQKSSQ
ncbi:response regulator [Natronococcus pandeyae]|uniref:Response regulator n=1 Tax=Natronococcus pandeyae TaxID=2055836 RepID=A0A8J8PX59_9EURY|nr:response regulator [Natronococcus pandeyae]TYL36095.1 response regulator [Natronococcus pandeyae]